MNNNIQVLCEQAKSLIEERNFEQATTVCDKILKNDPKSNFHIKIDRKSPKLTYLTLDN